jgi:hypothetical protein
MHSLTLHILHFTCLSISSSSKQRIVTCQPIVGLRKKALLGSRPLNASRPNTRCAAVGQAVFASCRAEQNRTERCYTAGRDDVTRQHARFQGNAGKHSSHLARKIEGL